MKITMYELLGMVKDGYKYIESKEKGNEDDLYFNDSNSSFYCVEYIGYWFDT